MPDRPVIAIFAGNKAVESYLGLIAARAGYDCVYPEQPAPAQSLILAAGHSGAANYSAEEGQDMLYIGNRPAAAGVQVVPAPVKAGQLIEYLQKKINGKQSLGENIEIGGNMVDVREALWLRPGEPPVRLTEKEVAVLVYLKSVAPNAVSRQALLDKIWSYADGVETHTIETHIYRLRQKIETDPSAPKIIVTTDDGYLLAE